MQALEFDCGMFERDHEILNYHPLVNTMTTSISRAGLVEFLKASGHEPRIEQVSKAPAAPAPVAPLP